MAVSGECPRSENQDAGYDCLFGHAIGVIGAPATESTKRATGHGLRKHLSWNDL